MMGLISCSRNLCFGLWSILFVQWTNLFPAAFPYFLLLLKVIRSRRVDDSNSIGLSTSVEVSIEKRKLLPDNWSWRGFLNETTALMQTACHLQAPAVAQQLILYWCPSSVFFFLITRFSQWLLFFKQNERELILQTEELACLSLLRFLPLLPRAQPSSSAP